MVLLAWLGLAAFQVFSAGQDARDGLDAMESLRGIATGDVFALSESIGGEKDDVAEEDAARRLRVAADDFGQAHGQLTSIAVKPLWLLPVVGRQLRSASALSEAAEQTASRAAEATDELVDVLNSSTATGDARLRAVQRSEEALTEFRDGIADLDLGPTEGLLPPLADARNRFASEYRNVTENLDMATTAVTGVNDFLSGPTRYLLLAANNAEMRAGSGMVLQVGPMEVENGSFEVGEFTATQNLFLEQPAAVLDADIEARWGSLVPAQEWRNTNLSPRFDQSAAIAADMWEASGGAPVEGVISVDVQAVERLLELTGPVELASGETISAETVVQDLLVEQYKEFGDDRDARRERLGQVAQAAFDAINERPVSAGDLMKSLRELGAGRHLLIWSSVSAQADAWRALGTDGVLAQDSMMLSVLNRGGNKLDPYLSVAATVTTDNKASAADGATVDGGAGNGAADSNNGEVPLRHVQVEVALSNHPLAGLPPYISGPYPFTDLTEGEYKGIVALTMPKGAGDITITGGTPAALGDDGPTRVAATEVRLLRNANTSVRFDFYLPTSWSTIEVLPGARIPPTTWTAGAESWTDEAAHVIRLDATG